MHPLRVLAITVALVALTGCASASDLVGGDPEPRRPGPVRITVAPALGSTPAKRDCGEDRVAPPDQDVTIVCGEQAGDPVRYRLDSERAAEVTLEDAHASQVAGADRWSVVLQSSQDSDDVIAR